MKDAEDFCCQKIKIQEKKKVAMSGIGMVVAGGWVGGGGGYREKGIENMTASSHSSIALTWDCPDKQNTRRRSRMSVFI